MVGFPRTKAAKVLPEKVLKKAWHDTLKNPPKTWTRSRGTIDAAYLSDRRVGWSFGQFDHVITDQGTDITLSETAPKLLAKLLREAAQRKWQRKMAAGLRAKGWAVSRVCPDPITNVMRSAWARKNPLPSQLRREGLL